VATSQGNIIINSGWTPGNATVFEGSTLQTDKAVSQVHLKDGGQVKFASESRGMLFSDHVDLQSGSAQVSGLAANANGLVIKTGKSGTAAIAIRGKATEVAALVGDVHVFNAQGINVANLIPGAALSLVQDAGAAAPSSLTGCAVRRDGNTLLTDETSNVTVQLRGGNVRPNRHVTVTGSLVSGVTPFSPATEVIDVTSVKDAPGSCKAPGAAAAGAAGAAGAGSAASAGGATAGIAGISLSAIIVTGIAIVAIGTTIAIVATSGTNTSPGSAQ
jgi:hypothetical protein